MSAEDSNQTEKCRLSTAQYYFIEAIDDVMEKVENKLYNNSCFKDASGKWYCRPSEKSFALYLSVRAVRWDFRDRYPKVWVRTAERLSEMAWDVYFVWRMARRHLHLSATEKAFWDDVMVEWRHQMNMWVFHPDFYFIDGEDEYAADPCLHPTWNWYTDSPVDEARRKRKLAKLQKASKEAKCP